MTVENLIVEKTKQEKEKAKKGTGKAKPRMRLEGKNVSLKGIHIFKKTKLKLSFQDYSTFGADDIDEFDF